MYAKNGAYPTAPQIAWYSNLKYMSDMIDIGVYLWNRDKISLVDALFCVSNTRFALVRSSESFQHDNLGPYFEIDSLSIAQEIINVDSTQLTITCVKQIETKCYY